MHMSDHIKQQIKGKMQERDRLEANISECTTRLEASGAGLHNQLIDKEVKKLDTAPDCLYVLCYLQLASGNVFAGVS